MDGDRIVDFANLDGMGWEVNLVRMLENQDAVSGDSSLLSRMGLMDRVGGADDSSLITTGIELQLVVAAGLIQVSHAAWNDYSTFPEDKDKAIDRFRVFLGIPPEKYPVSQVQTSSTFMVAPFTAAQKIAIIRRYKVSDPFVHYTTEDVSRALGVGKPWQYSFPPNYRVPFVVGTTNENYGGWAGNRSRDFGGDSRVFNEQVTDPGVYGSEEWVFGSGSELNHRFFDRLHRGTPGQTIYYHSENVDPNLWERYRGAPESMPEPDWDWIAEFRKDWLGLPVIEAVTPEPVLGNNTIANNFTSLGTHGAAIHLEPRTSARIANNIVAFNAAGIEQLPEGSPMLFSNALFGNTNGNYVGLMPGTLDLDDDPQFRNPARGDFSLSTTSPLLDSAHPIVALLGWLDGEEPARWQNEHLDFGAAEVAVDVAPWLTIQASPIGTTQTLTVFGYPGLRYDVEASTDFEYWEPLGEAFPASGKHEIFIEPSGDKAFIRAKSGESGTTGLR